MDQQPLYDRWDSRIGYHLGTNRAIAQTPFESIRRPSDSDVPFDPNDTTGWFVFYRGNYVCCAGNIGVANSTSTTLDVLGSRLLGTTTIKNGGQAFVISNPANFEYKKIESVKDGTSNTLAFSECLQGTRNGTTSQDLRGAVFHAAFCWFTTWLPPNSKSSADASPDSSGCCVSTRDAPCVSGSAPVALAARSRHPGGVNVCLLDGSTRFVSDLVAWNTWQALGTTAGAETIQGF